MENKLTIAAYDDGFFEAMEQDPKITVILGVKESFVKYSPYFRYGDSVCEIQETELALQKELVGRKIIKFEELVKQKNIYILFCLNGDLELYQQICLLLFNSGVNAKIFNFFHNKSFPFFYGNYEYNYIKNNKPLKVKIINYEGGGWILTKFAERMNQYLLEMGIQSEIGGQVDPDADVNHHIPSHPYMPLGDFCDTLMITHVDTKYKADLLKFQLERARMGICMSKETMEQLQNYGIAREKLCYVNPAHDGNMRPKKYVIGITHRCYDKYDLRKRTNCLLDIVKYVNSDYFKFVIMGAGWDLIVKDMREMEFSVDYYPEFNYVKYHEIMPTLDFYMFFGFDEGSMGYLDALAAGVKTIVTPQGFHLDVKEGIDYPCSTVEQFANTLLELQFEREKRIAQISEWSWENYVKKHVEIWSYLTRRKPLKELYQNKLSYQDGIFSCLVDDTTYLEKKTEDKV